MLDHEMIMHQQILAVGMLSYPWIHPLWRLDSKLKQCVPWIQGSPLAVFGSIMVIKLNLPFSNGENVL